MVLSSGGTEAIARFDRTARYVQGAVPAAPLAVWMMRSFLIEVPVAILESASLDGAGGSVGPRRLAGEDDPEVHWGVAEFLAAEEMGRARGFWWAPDGRRLAVARVDLHPVRRFHLTDPSNPAIEPVHLPYPAAGTDNAEVGLHVVDLDGRRVEVGWDRAAYPYLAAVRWEAGGPLTLLVQARDQTATLVLAADPDTGAVTAVRASAIAVSISLFTSVIRAHENRKPDASTRSRVFGGYTTRG